MISRGSMFAFQWRDFSSPLNSAHRLLHRQERDRRRCNSRGTQNTYFSLTPQLGPLANERALSSNVTLWRCTFWSGKFESHSFRSLATYGPSPGAHSGQGSWKAKEFPLIAPYYTHIRGHGNESLPGTWWWVWSWGLWDGPKKCPRSALKPKDLKPIPKCSL